MAILPANRIESISAAVFGTGFAIVYFRV